MVVQARIAMDRTKPFFIYWFLFPIIRMQQIIAHSVPCRHIKLFDAYNLKKRPLSIQNPHILMRSFF